MNSDNADEDGIEERGFHVNRHYEVWYELKYWVNLDDSILEGFAESVLRGFSFHLANEG